MTAHPSVNRPLTAKRARTDAEYIDAVIRMVRALGPRMADGDLYDLLKIQELIEEANEVLHGAVRAQRERHGYSWANVARVFGWSRQAAQQKFGGYSNDRD